MQNISQQPGEAPKGIKGIKEALRDVNDLDKRYAENIIHAHQENGATLYPKPSKEITIATLRQFHLAVSENVSYLSAQDIGDIQALLGGFAQYLMDPEEQVEEGLHIIDDIIILMKKKSEKPVERKKIEKVLNAPLEIEAWAKNAIVEIQALEKQSQGNLKKIRPDPDSAVYKAVRALVDSEDFKKMKLDTFFKLYATVKNFRENMDPGSELEGGLFLPFGTAVSILENKMSLLLNSRATKKSPASKSHRPN